MLSFKEFLNEKVSDNFLYHLDSLDEIENILKNNPTYSTISLTRNKNITSIFGTNNKYFQLVLDKEKIHNNYKIYPYADISDGLPNNLKNLGYTEINFSQTNSESEERINNFKNIKKYIIKINFINFKDLAYFKKCALRYLKNKSYDVQDIHDDIEFLEKIKRIIIDINKKFDLDAINNGKVVNIKTVINEIDTILELENKLLYFHG